MGIDRELDHLEGRYMLAFVSRVRKLCIRQVPERIHLFLCRWRPCRVYLDKSTADRLDQHRRLEHVRICLDHMEILGKGYLVLAASLI